MAFDLLLREILKLQLCLMSGLEQISSFLNELKISVHNDLSIQVCCRRASCRPTNVAGFFLFRQKDGG